MHSIKIMLATVGTLFAAALLTGCQSKELAACKDRTAFLERRMGEYQQVVDMRDKDIKDRNDELKSLTAAMVRNEEKMNLLKKENQELHNKLAQTSEGAKNILQGAIELKRLQQEAAEKLRQQEAPKPTDSSPVAPSTK
jgi:small-conductance mechanosensitive channel